MSSSAARAVLMVAACSLALAPRVGAQLMTDVPGLESLTFLVEDAEKAQATQLVDGGTVVSESAVATLGSLSMTETFQGYPHRVLGARVALRLAGVLVHRHGFCAAGKTLTDAARAVYAAWGTADPSRKAMADLVAAGIDRNASFLASQGDGLFPPPAVPIQGPDLAVGTITVSPQPVVLSGAQTSVTINVQVVNLGTEASSQASVSVGGTAGGDPSSGTRLSGGGTLPALKPGDQVTVNISASLTAEVAGSCSSQVTLGAEDADWSNNTKLFSFMTIGGDGGSM